MSSSYRFDCTIHGATHIVPTSCVNGGHVWSHPRGQRPLPFDWCLCGEARWDGITRDQVKTLEPDTATRTWRRALRGSQE